VQKIKRHSLARFLKFSDQKVHKPLLFSPQTLITPKSLTPLFTHLPHHSHSLTLDLSPSKTPPSHSISLALSLSLSCCSLSLAHPLSHSGDVYDHQRSSPSLAPVSLTPTHKISKTQNCWVLVISLPLRSGKRAATGDLERE
jgi:hypothetical protein